MLHGATSTGREDFAAQVPLLSKAFRLYLPDARGHGSTPWDAADGFTYDQLVDDVLAFVDALGLDTFHLARILDGRDDRAPARQPLPRSAPYPDRGRDHDPARAPGERRPAADGSRADRPGRSSLGRPSSADATMPSRARAPGAGSCRRSRRMLRSNHSSGRATCAGSSCRPWSPSAITTRSCRSTTPGA